MKQFVVCLHDVAPRAEMEIMRQLDQLKSHIGLNLSTALIPASAGPTWEELGGDYQAELLATERLMHGFIHARPRPGSFLSMLTGRVDEMAGLNPEETARRLADGQKILTEQFGSTVKGFLPPAWRMGCVTPTLARKNKMDFLVGFRTLQGPDCRRIKLATFSWDWGKVASLGHLGTAWGRTLKKAPGSLPVIALHPCDESRGFLAVAIDEIRKLQDRGYTPATFGQVLGTSV